MTDGSRPSLREWDSLQHMAQMHRVEEKLLAHGDGAVFATWLVLRDKVTAMTESWKEREQGQDAFDRGCVEIVSALVATHFPYSTGVSGMPMCNGCRSVLWPCDVMDLVVGGLRL